MAGLLIGELAQRAGLPSPTIRYYESIGLLTAPGRSSAGYRRYSNETVEELQFIKKAQTLGFSLDEIGEILTLTRMGKAPCSHVLSLAQQHLAAVEERIQQLRRFRDHLASELGKWDGKTTPTCTGFCQIIASAQPGTAAECAPLHPNVRRRPTRLSVK